MLPPNRRCATRAGFTLIEVLVVVAIIALLTAILLPSLKRARGQAQATVCASNLHQLGLGLALYHRTYDAYPAHRSPKPQDWRWFYSLARMLQKAPHAADGPPKPSRVQKCPTVSDWETGRNNAYGYNYKYLGSARSNDDSPTAPYENWPVRAVKKASMTIAFGDCDGTGWTEPHMNDNAGPDWKNPERIGNHGYTLDPPYIPIRALPSLNNDGVPEPYAWHDRRSYPSERHNGRANFCFADGHVDRLLPEQVMQDNRRWNGLGREDPLVDKHVPYKHADGTPWRYGSKIPAS